MTRYQTLVQDIFRRFPSVQKDGFTSGAYKPGLERMLAFDEALGFPSKAFKSIHVAGTNGKGSVANMLASSLGACGYKIGLFTSPHLLDFRERMRIGHGLVPCGFVQDFLEKWLPFIEAHELSFFEITTGMAFAWFAHEKVDAAVIEVGLGGRLDSTNILRPQLALVTTIGLDHCALLGNTLGAIAGEKAGIFKAGVPAVVGETQEETAPVFLSRAQAVGCPLYFADTLEPLLWDSSDKILEQMDLQASVQRKNLRTVLVALSLLQPVFPALANSEAVMDGLIHTARNMDFHGRWERLSLQPYVLADIGHNPQALGANFAQLSGLMHSGRFSSLSIVFGIMADKDLDAVLPLMPRNARYYFAAAASPRALPAPSLLQRFRGFGNAVPSVMPGPVPSVMPGSDLPVMPGSIPSVMPGPDRASLAAAYPSIPAAVSAALSDASPSTLIYIGGSAFVVAEALPLFG